MKDVSRFSHVMNLILPTILLFSGSTYCSENSKRLPSTIDNSQDERRFVEVEITSSTDLPEFVSVPQGDVTIGISETLRKLRSILEKRSLFFFREPTIIPVEDIYDDYTPIHTENIKQFRVTKFEISFGEYKEFRDSIGRPIETVLLYRGTRAAQESPQNLSKVSSLPACWISYEMAESYCAWLSERIGQRCRLPTESEWEYLAKGKHEYLFPTGNRLPDDECHVRFGPRENCGANDFGVYGLACNVHEWCVERKIEPTEKNETQEQIGKRVLRGGAFMLDMSVYSPELYLSVLRIETDGDATLTTGFRVVAEVD